MTKATGLLAVTAILVGAAPSDKKSVSPAVKLEPPQLPLEQLRDDSGRLIIHGPVYGNYYNNVHIISQSVGVYSTSPVYIENSYIQAPVCISAPSQGNRVISSEFNCNLGVEFRDGLLLNNRLIKIRFRGQFTNRPNVFK